MDSVMSVTLLGEPEHISASAIVPSQGDPFVAMTIGDLHVYMPREQAAQTARKLAADLVLAAERIEAVQPTTVAA